MARGYRQGFPTTICTLLVLSRVAGFLKGAESSLLGCICVRLEVPISYARTTCRQDAVDAHIIVVSEANSVPGV